MKVFLDANIFFSGANAGSNINALVHSLIRHKACITNQHAIGEASRNLQSKRPEWTKEFASFISRIPSHESVAHVTGVPEKDRPILGGAVSAKCTHLVTGDLHDFRSLLGKTYEGVRIVTPRMLADELVRLDWAKPPKG